MDNGFIGEDGVAHTASPPYEGLDSNGEYVVVKRIPGVVSGTFDLYSNNSAGFVSMAGMTMGISAMPALIDSAMVGIFASMSGTGTAAHYRFGVPQFTEVSIPTLNAGERFTLNLDELFPDVVTPSGVTVVRPAIDDAYVDDANDALVVNIKNDNPGQFVGEIAVRAIFDDGTYHDVEVISGSYSGVYEIGVDKLVNAAGKPIAIGSVQWQLVRVIRDDVYSASGNLEINGELEFAGNLLRVEPKHDMAAVLTRTGIDIIRQNKVEGSVNLVDRLNNEIGFDTYLTGGKVQPVTFSTDLSRIYVGGKGVVYVIDTLSYRLIDTIEIPAGKNISAMDISGNLLFIGEGERNGGGRLLMMDINPGSPYYNQNPLELKVDAVNSAPLGVAGMAIAPDGKTLVVSLPEQYKISSLGDPNEQGNVVVIDLSTLDFQTGDVTSVVAEIPSDGLSGKSPRVVNATYDSNRFLIGSVNDYNRGLTTLDITRNEEDDSLVSAELKAVEMKQPTSDILIDRLNIQRAESAVLVNHNGVEYAIVADDNHHFLDPYWKAMYEAPNFLMSPTGGLFAFGGSASAKKVAVGGKLGIVQNPFGKENMGETKFIGASLPMDGYGIRSLSLSEDSKVMIGHLYGMYSGDMNSEYWLKQYPHQVHAWDTAALIEAALANPEEDRMRKHFVMPDNAAQILSESYAPPAGTYFDPEVDPVEVVGNMGDIVEVDLKAKLAASLGVNADTLSDFMILEGDLKFHADDHYEQYNPDAQFKLVTVKGVGAGKDDPYSRDTSNQVQKFKDTGRMYMAPILDKDDLHDLRLGYNIPEKSAWVNFTFKQNEGGIIVEKKGAVRVIARDVENINTFFGDRPLDNPGYSSFTLLDDQSTVGVNGTNDALDVYRVEQRLAYLGYTAFGSTQTPGVSATNATSQNPQSPAVPNNFEVDGVFEDRDESALRAFYQITHFNYRNISGNDGIEDATAPTERTVTTSNDNFEWLNAYNAPHWMNVYESLNIPYGLNQTEGSYTSGQSSYLEAYGTSWLRDWLQAWDVNRADQALSQYGLTNTGIRVSGLTDPTRAEQLKPNGDYIQHGSGSHTIGMSLDMSLRPYVTSPIWGDVSQNVHNIPAQTISGWSLQNAVDLTALSQLASDPLNNQQQALRNFLSLYAISRSDAVTGNGTWDDIDIQSGSTQQKATIRTALFGGGQSGNSLVRHTWIGGTATQNQYANMNEILRILGIASNPQPGGHNNHFHINLRAPGIQTIDTSGALLSQGEFAAENSLSPKDGEELSVEKKAAIISIMNEVMPYLSEELWREAIMFAIDLPPEFDGYDQQMVIAQADNLRQTSEEGWAATIGVCHLVDNPPVPIDSAVNGLLPAVSLSNYLRHIENKDVNYNDAVSELVEAPKHGSIVKLGSAGGYRYIPDENYMGMDKAVFIVSVGNVKYKLIHFLNVSKGFGDDDYENELYCPKGILWKIDLESGDASIAPLGYRSSLAWATRSLNMDELNLEFSSLSGGMVGFANGNVITLDNNANSYGWYVDLTPGLNDAYSGEREHQFWFMVNT